MATFYDQITAEQAELLRTAPLFFVASCDPELADGPDGIGPVNLSPKGGVPLHLLDANTVAYLDHPGSGNATSRHIGASPQGGTPVTLMVCSFDEQAAIVRLYGRATVHGPGTPLFERLSDQQAEALGKPRQVICLSVARTQTSCGYGVPLMDNPRDRRKDERGRRYKQPPAQR
ncbi:MAG TPA: pyridoxamine 5'-phosphate oxidase family protein [Herpetosiphonaceae bacterium]